MSIYQEEEDKGGNLWVVVYCLIPIVALTLGIIHGYLR
jgi:hypothetical protein